MSNMPNNGIDRANIEGNINQHNFRIFDDRGQISKETIKNCLKPPYPLKYYFNIGIIVIGAILLPLIYFGILPMHQQGFFCNDPLFSHTFTGNTITPIILFIGEVCLILMVLLVEILARQKSFKRICTFSSLLESYYYIKYILLGLFLVETTTEVAKSIVGEHRPDFFDMCKPDSNMNCTDGEYVGSFTCTNTERFDIIDLVDSSRSFPSGHSSISWFTALYCAYIIHKCVPETTGSLFKIFMLIVCISWGALCSLSRITDRRHHWWDVLIGSIMGVIGAIYMVRLTEKRIKSVFRIYCENEFKDTNVI